MSWSQMQGKIPNGIPTSFLGEGIHSNKTKQNKLSCDYQKGCIEQTHQIYFCPLTAGGGDEARMSGHLLRDIQLGGNVVSQYYPAAHSNISLA